jgi:eukaryotic-like serine/threonine-protein kinase
MPKLPQSIGPFTVLESLGRGGTSQVYKAVHPERKKTVVLKKLTLKGVGPVKERFRREADLMMGFNHEHIVKVYDIFKEGSSWIIVQEFVDGPNLEEVINRRGELGKKASLSLTLQCLKALVYIHQKGVVHRDIKPSNIFLTSRGDVKLGDFGIASRLDGGKGLTREGAALGTPDFMAPEQALDPAGVDGRADLYALALTWYEAWTGEPWPRRGRPSGTVRFTLAGRLLCKGARKNRFFRFNSARSMLMQLRLLLFPLIVSLPSDLKLTSKEREGSPLKKKTTPPKKGSSSKEGRLKEKTHSKKYVPLKILLGAALLGLLFLGGRYLYFQVLGKERYIRFSTEIPYTVHTAPWYRKEVELRLYKDEQEGRLHRERRFLLMDRGEEQKLATRSVFLTQGSYRLRVTLPDREEWHRFYLKGNEKILTLDELDFPLEPLTIDAVIVDSLTGELIENASWELIAGDEPVPLNGPLPVIPNETTLLSVRAPGYGELRQEIRPVPFQAVLKLRLALLPDPALLVITQEIDKEEASWKNVVKIDGSTNYLSWDDSPHWARIDRNSREILLYLAPGVHTVEIGRTGNVVTKELDMKSGQTYELK